MRPADDWTHWEIELGFTFSDDTPSQHAATAVLAFGLLTLIALGFLIGWWIL